MIFAVTGKGEQMRLIDASDVKRRGDCYLPDIRKTIANILSHTKTVKDAVVIVRCKDCKYCEHWYADKGRCFLWHEYGIDVFEDGFCNYAERRTDE